MKAEASHVPYVHTYDKEGQSFCFPPTGMKSQEGVLCDVDFVQLKTRIFFWNLALFIKNMGKITVKLTQFVLVVLKSEI